MRNRIYTDGACINNGLVNAIASWSYIVTDNSDDIITACTGKVVGVQNNSRAELIAFINSLKYVRQETGYFTIYVDFETLILYCNGKVKPKRSLELFKIIDELLIDCYPRVEIKKVKAHSKSKNIVNVINGVVDKVAKKTVNFIYKENLYNNGGMPNVIRINNGY